MSIEAMKQALECLERVLSHGSAVQMAKDVLRQAIEQAEQRADAHLFYAQGDVLICKESNEKAVVMYGNTGLRQLVNGKIALAWSDEVYGEYTLEQIMDGFIREVQPEQAQPAARLERTAEGLAFTPLHVNGVPDGALLYTAPPPHKPWAGLTAKEKKEIERLSVYVDGAIRLTEAKLKEKNT